MADIVSAEKRRKMMAGIKGRNTIPEVTVRRGLHASGFRFRLHVTGLPGKPDLVLPRWNAVIFVNGCFWHGHDCHLFKWPKSRETFWREKINETRARDSKNMERLIRTNWRVLIVWECALKGRKKLPEHKVIRQIAHWIKTGEQKGVIQGETVQG